jgi:hypothetical protein
LQQLPFWMHFYSDILGKLIVKLRSCTGSSTPHLFTFGCTLAACCFCCLLHLTALLWPAALHLRLTALLWGPAALHLWPAAMLKLNCSALKVNNLCISFVTSFLYRIFYVPAQSNISVWKTKHDYCHLFRPELNGRQ